MSAPRILSPTTTSGGTPVGGSGTPDTIPRWSTGTTLTNSILSQTSSGNAIRLNGITFFAGTAGSGTGGNYRITDDSGADKWLMGLLGTAGARTWTLYDIVNAQTRVAVDGTSGNVGIGTASPGARLHVLDTVNAQHTIFSSTNASRGYTEYRYNTSASLGYFGTANGITTGGASTDFAWRVETGGSLVMATGVNERARIDSSGNVGIGTASPSHRLAVVGGDIFRHNTFTDASNYKGTRLSSATYSGAEYSTLTVVGIGTFASSNIGLVLQPLGTGAITAQMPDGTATGGNARGANAVDLQTARTAASQVATGTYSFAAGYANTVSNIAACAIGEGNSAAGARSLAIGLSNTASGANSVAIGQECVASTTRACSIGYQNTASQIGSCALGYQTSATGDFSMATGLGAAARLYAARAHASGGFAANGDNQIITLVARVGTTDATKTALWLNGTSQRLVLPANTTWAAAIYVTGRSTGGTDNAFYIRQCVIKRDGANNTALVGTVQTIGTDIESNAAWDVEVTADDTNEALQIAVTGAAATTIRWVARVELVEVGLA